MRRQTPRPDSLFARVHAVIRRIPRGRVTTYGDVAHLVGLRNGARTVGWALHSLPTAEAAPWWRVIRSDGTIALRRAAAEQRRRLTREGVRFKNGIVDLKRHGWR